MRKLLTLLILVAACGGDDAAVDPGPDAGAPLNLTWTRENGARPDVAGTTMLTVEGLTLTYGGGPGGEVHIATGIDAGCLVVPEQADQQGRRPYRLCEDGTGYSATIAWLAIGGSPPSGTWRLQAWR